MAKNVRELILDYLDTVRLMQVATCVDNMPWACSVYFAYDKSLNLYWISQPTRKHSDEIRKNPQVAGAIVLPHTPGDDVRGIQFQGKAQELREKSEMESAMSHYAKRYTMPLERVNEILQGSDGHVPYKIIPTLFVLFDEVNFPDDPRKEYIVD